ncbi:MAG: GNAT family N-acetyltransferase [Acidimicrobiaceae bacterium]|nr:GNAT family N-acetyltransferase [Acidimicrobiaceae bacterium]
MCSPIRSRSIRCRVRASSTASRSRLLLPERHRPAEVLEGPSLVLRRVDAAYAAELSEALRASIPELRNFMDWAQDDPSAEDAVGEFLAICDRDWIADRAYNFHVFLADSDALIGNCALMRRVGSVAIEIGYWIRSDHAGRGYATEAAAILVEAAWGIDSIERIVIRHDLANGASGRVAEKLGFGEIDRVAVEVMAEGESGVDLIRELIRPERF